MRQYLLIVAQNQPELCNYLARSFAGEDRVEVVLDRRAGQRRERVRARDPERRRGERRRPISGGKLLSLGVLIVPREPGAPSLQCCCDRKLSPQPN